MMPDSATLLTITRPKKDHPYSGLVLIFSQTAHPKDYHKDINFKAGYTRSDSHQIVSNSMGHINFSRDRPGKWLLHRKRIFLTFQFTYASTNKTRSCCT